MKPTVCILGAGPSGLYTAKFLSDANIPTVIYEKSDRILGNYHYALEKSVSLEEVVKRDNVTLKLGTTIPQSTDYDFYVVATGGIPRALTIKGAEFAKDALDVIKAQDRGAPMGVGKRVCVIGMGDVAFDLLVHLYKKCKDVTFLSRGPWTDAAFDNHILRKLLEEDKWRVSSNFKEAELKPKAHEPTVPGSERMMLRRRDMLKKTRPGLLDRVLDWLWPSDKKLKLIFGAEPVKITQEGSRLRLEYFMDGRRHSNCFDDIIASVGFRPNRVDVETDKPVIHVGWARKPRGNIEDIRQEAKACSDAILRMAQEGAA